MIALDSASMKILCCWRYEQMDGLFSNEDEEKAASHTYLCQILLLVIQTNAAITDKVSVFFRAFRKL